jgi:hypothetical protein
MKDDHHIIWSAFSLLVDYFSRLGGAARYPNMSDPEIPLYIACRLLQKHSPEFNQDDFIDQRFIKSAQPVIEQIYDYIESVKAEGASLVTLVQEFIEHINSKVEPQERTSQWLKISGIVEELSAQQSAQVGQPPPPSSSAP